MKLIAYHKPRFWKTFMRFMPAILIVSVIICGTYVISQLVSTDAAFSRPVIVYTASPDKQAGPNNVIGDLSNDPVWMQQLYKQSSLPPIIGNRSLTKKFLSIGISTVYREENYLETALNSFIDETYPDERENAVVIIYLADTELENKEKQLTLIETKFRPYIDSGFIQIITSTPDIYPSMSFALTKRTFNDSVDRVIWRTKQVVDFAFLFSYIKFQAEYHIVVEDDVIVAPEFITAIQDYIVSKRNTRWVALHFSQFLGIGLLFHARELPKISQFLLMFHEDQPVDMLLRKYIQIENGETEIMRRVPSLFQHIGIQSTLPNKLQKATDSSFNIGERRFRNRNPKIKEINSTMLIFKDYSPSYAYAGTPGFFWGIPRKPSETFEIFFQAPTTISRLVIISGLPINGTELVKDPIQEATVEVSRSSPESPEECDQYELIGNLQNGEFDEFLIPVLSNIKCVRLKIVPNGKKWIIIREIEIFK